MPGVGLDVYVGPLTRYYTGDWETIIEQLGREGAFAVEVVRPDGEDQGERLTDPAEVTELVLAWRTALSAAIGQELEWIEDPSAPVFTDKPAWDGYGSL